jgi:DNA-binding transcriptional MerR regulator
MLEINNNNELPPIPNKQYFKIGEVAELCNIKQHVLRYWEKEFPQLRPVKRRGNWRYYRREDVMLIRQISTLLYERGFSIAGARQELGGNSDKSNGTHRQQIIRQTILELEELRRLLDE